MIHRAWLYLSAIDAAMIDGGMTFDEAIAAPGRKVQLWPNEVRDGKRIVMIYSLGEAGAKRLAWRELPDTDRAAVAADLSSRGIEVAGYDFYCTFVWITKGDGLEVYDKRGRVLEAVGDTATLEDGRVIARADIERVFAFADDDYVYRGIKGTLRSGQEVPLATEAARAPMGDPTYTRNQLLMETGWATTLGTAIATWAGTTFVDLI
jgi:hypothetical protein